MSKSPRYRPVVLLRGALLVALALFLGGVVAVFISNRAHLQVEVEPQGRNGLDLNLAEDLLTGRGFDYEVTDGDRRLYHIRADRILANRDNVITLTGIVLTLERASGDVYELAAKEGTFQSEKHTAEVEGDVVLSGPNGVEMRGQKFSLLRRGALVKSRGPVQFSAGRGLTGSADEVEAYLKKDQFKLSGEVRLVNQGSATESALTLNAEHVVYDKRQNMIHAEGGVMLRRDRDRLTCDRIAVTLAGTELPRDSAIGASGTIAAGSPGLDGSENPEDTGGSGSRFVRARWNVAGSMVSRDVRGFDRRIRFAGDEISIAYGDKGGEPRQAEITGSAKDPARLDATDDTGLVRRFSSHRIEAAFTGGKVREIRTGGAMIMTEFLAFDASRELGRVCGGSATATFDAGGDLARFRVAGGADLHRAGLQTTGETLTLLAEDRVEVHGTPAHVYTRRGELSAPDLAYLTSSGDLDASDGVRAWFPPKSGFAMVKATQATDDLPMQVTSDTATWAEAEGRFQFYGDVRAWQGESFLTARRLIGENDGRIQGEGGIQTTLERTPRAISEVSDAGKTGQLETGEAVEEGDQGNEQPSPVRVTAESFDYKKGEGLIEYKGTVEVRESGRIMSCDDLSVYLRESASLDRLECRGNTLIDDRIGNHKIRGSEAVYRPDDSEVEVSGTPVILQRPDGAVIRARRVFYDFETSIAQFQSEASQSPDAVGQRGDRSQGEDGGL